MTKPFLLTFIFCALVLFSFSQSDESLVKTSSKGLFIEHKVAAKENFYSIGREFNVHPKHLASYNALDMAKGLSLGQVVNIPLSDSNVNRNSAEGTPLYYKSSLKQTVGTISAISKTPADNIRKWNNLTNDIAPNTSVIIGYLISVGEAPVAVTPADKAPGVAEVKKAVDDKKESIAIQQPKQEESKIVNTPKVDSVKKDSKPIIKEEAVKKPATIPASVSGDGFFKSTFLQQVKIYPLSKDQTVTSGIFKTANGWKDAKYYAMIDGVEPGTIIKIVNPVNDKTIYAKVLGQMNGIHQNQGLDLRISNAAASTLDIKETDKFIVKVNY